MLELLVDQALHLGDAHHHDESPLKVEARGVNFWYNEEAHALIDVDLSIYDREVVALIGPSGCGKSTFIRCLNRTNDLIDGARLEGKILLNGEDIYDPSLDPPDVRKRFGIVAQRPNPFPQSIFANIAYGPRLQGLVSGKSETEEVVHNSLVRVGMWDEVKDRLQELGTDLSGGQQQRLCIARAIATNPEMMLMDEPCSALDPTATQLIENLIDSLREEFAIIIITHNLQQAARISQRTAFFHLGRLIEVGDTEKIFLNPTEERTHDYITGRFG